MMYSPGFLCNLWCFGDREPGLSLVTVIDSDHTKLDYMKLFEGSGFLLIL